MKNTKAKSLVKAARKKAKEDIQTSLILNLKEVTARLKYTSKKLDKKIEKGTKILAKKIARELVIDGTALVKESEHIQSARAGNAPIANVTPKTKVAVKKEAAKAKPAKADAAAVTAS